MLILWLIGGIILLVLILNALYIVGTALGRGR
jgi:hypothetical protein